MHTKLPPSRQSKHGLSQCLSDRAELRVEGFHGPLGHCANTGSTTESADALNMMGTCIHNVTMRHKVFLIELQKNQGRAEAADCLDVPMFFCYQPNHLSAERHQKIEAKHATKTTTATRVAN